MGGSSGGMATSETKLEALQIQSSAYGVTIPVVGGVNRVPGNLINYLGFVATPITSSTSQGGKGGSATSTSTTFEYSASVQMAICHGPGTIARIWKGKEVYAGGWAAPVVARANHSFTPSAGTMSYVMANAATMIGAPTVNASYSTSVVEGESGATLTTQYDTQLSYGTDYVVSGTTLTVLISSWQGIPLTIQYQYGTGTVDMTPLTELGLSLSPGNATQTAPGWITSSAPAQAINYRGLMYVHSSSYSLGAGAKVDNHSFEVQGSGAYRYGSTKPDCNPAEFIAEVLMNGVYGAGMPSIRLEVLDWVRYCAAADLLMSPALTEQMPARDLISRACELTNSAAVWSVDTLKIIPYGDVPVTANGITYTPNTVPIYDLSDDNWTPNQGEDPLVWVDSGQAQRYNNFKMEYCDRTTYYNKTVVEVKDDADIATNGIRTAPTVVAHWICDANVARMVLQMLLQRSLSITRIGRVTLPWAFCLLEPMDLVTVSDSFLQLNKLPVRILRIGEDADRALSVEFEDWPLGTASPSAYTTQVPGGYLHDYRAAPGPVSTPFFFEAPTELTGTGLAVYAAVKGNSDLWGGCTVWVSLDGLTYKKAGTVYGASRMGVLSASNAAADTSISVTGVSGQLLSGSAGDASALTTLCYLGGITYEYFSYQGATLTAAGAYTLTGCIRGAYESVPGLNSIGDPFVRVDDSIAKSEDLPLDFIGKTIYFKFTSFNIFVAAEEDISVATAYPYTVIGTMAKLPPADATGIVAGVENGQAYIRWDPCQETEYSKTRVQVGNTASTSATAPSIYEGKASTALWSPYPATGSYNVFITHFDAFGASSIPQAIVATVTAAGISSAASGTNLVMNGDFWLRSSPSGDPGRPYDPAGFAAYEWGYALTGYFAWVDRVGRDGTGRCFALEAVNAAPAGPVNGRAGLVTTSNVVSGLVTGGVSNGWRAGQTYTVSYWARAVRSGTTTTESDITHVATTSGNGSMGSGGTTITKPSGLAVGDVMIAAITYDQYPSGVTLAISGWTRIGTQQGQTSPNGRITTAFYKVATTTETAAASFALTASGSSSTEVEAWVCTAYRGVDGTTPLAVTGSWASTTAAAATAPTAPGITTTGNTGIVWIGATDPNPSAASTVTAPGGYTLRGSATSSNGAVGLADKLPKAANGTVAALAGGTTGSTTFGYDAVMIALKPASTSGGAGEVATEWENIATTDLYWNTYPASVVNESAIPTVSYQWRQFRHKITWGASVDGAGSIYIGMRGASAGVTPLPAVAAGHRIEFDDLMVSLGSEYPVYEQSPQDGIAAASIVTAALADEAATALRYVAYSNVTLNSLGRSATFGTLVLTEPGDYEITLVGKAANSASPGVAEYVELTISTLSTGLTFLGASSSGALYPPSTPASTPGSMQVDCAIRLTTGTSWSLSLGVSMTTNAALPPDFAISALSIRYVKIKK